MVTKEASDEYPEGKENCTRAGPGVTVGDGRRSDSY